jgi:peptide/nickel transport system permease protein
MDTVVTTTDPQRSFWRKIRSSRFGGAIRNNPLSIIGILIVIIFFALAIAPSAFTSINPIKLNLVQRLKPPSAQHFFGTDQVGMDVFARVIYGASTSLKIVLVVLAIAVSLGYLVGSLSGFFGGKVDTLLMRVTDVFLAFPPLILAIAINAALGRGLYQSMIAVGLSWWPSYSRLIRAQILSVKNEEFVTAAEVMGATKWRILVKHILLNCFDPIIVTMTLDVGYIALTTAGLSFLGLGAEPPTPEWGRMISEGREYLLDQWWVTTYPGMALFFLVVGFNLAGEMVRDWLDPSAINRM